MDALEQARRRAPRTSSAGRGGDRSASARRGGTPASRAATGSATDSRRCTPGSGGPSGGGTRARAGRARAGRPRRTGSAFSRSSCASSLRFSASDRPASDCGAIVMTVARPVIGVTPLSSVQEGGQEGIDLVAGQVIDAGEQLVGAASSGARAWPS